MGQATATCYCSLGEVGTATCYCSLGEVGQGTATCYCKLGEVGQPRPTKATTIFHKEFVKCNKNVSQEREKEREKQQPTIPSVDAALLAASRAAKLDHVLA